MNKIIDKLLIRFMIIVVVTGFAISFSGSLFIMVILHKLSAVLFLAFAIMHVLQYRKKKIKRTERIH